MACSGINEHKEGCRKQRVLDRAAHARRMMMDDMFERDQGPAHCGAAEDPEAPGYMRRAGSPPGVSGNPFSYQKECRDRNLIDMDGSHSPTAVDRLRREGVRAQQLVAYTAKIPNRLSSVNYTQQW